MPDISLNADNGLLKHSLAEQLRTEILNGSLRPGMRIVEATWAAKFGVAQASITGSGQYSGPRGVCFQSFRA